MGLTSKTYEQPATPATVRTELRFEDSETGSAFVTGGGSLHIYTPRWGSGGPVSIQELSLIQEAIGRFIQALIPEEVK